MRYIDELRRSWRREYEIRRLRRRNDENVERIVWSFYKEVREGYPILVEGMKDVRALFASFGPGNYVTINRRRMTLRAILQESVELFGRRQIVMTDLDRKGNALAKKITNILNELGAMAILKYRRMLSLMNVSFVESLESKADEIRAMLGIIDVQTHPRPKIERSFNNARWSRISGCRGGTTSRILISLSRVLM